MATYAIGDVQGCYDPLMRLLDKLRFNPSQDTLWFAGDLVNRGRQSLETLRFIRSLRDAAICVLGNHDISLIAAFHGLRKPHNSLQILTEAHDYPDLIRWLAQRPLLHVDTTLGYAISHAGICPQWDLATAQACAREVETATHQPQRRRLAGYKFTATTPITGTPLCPTHDRHRYILNAFTRMRYCRPDGSLDFDAKGKPDADRHIPTPSAELIPWFNYPTRQ